MSSKEAEILPSPEKKCFICRQTLVLEEAISKIRQTKIISNQPVVTIFTTVTSRCKNCKSTISSFTFETNS